MEDLGTSKDVLSKILGILHSSCFLHRGIMEILDLDFLFGSGILDPKFLLGCGSRGSWILTK